MTARLRPLTAPRSLVLAACGLALVLAAAQLVGQTPTSSLQILSSEGRRPLNVTVVGTQDMLALDELAGAFQLNVRDDGGAITVAYRGRTIVLTPEQTIASVAGRLISLSSPPVRSGARWLVPLDFINRALAPIYDARLDLRRPSRLIVVGDVRVPSVIVRLEALAAATRVTLDISPAATPSVAQPSSSRLVVRFDADSLDVSIPPIQPTGFVQAVQQADQSSIAIDLGPRFTMFRSVTQPAGDGIRVTIDAIGSQTDATPQPQTPAPTELPPLDLTPDTATLRTVAIDAGHGGDDGGARGSGGTLEKDITLAVARRLKAALEGRLGLRVIMTRDDDRLVPIESRAAQANNNKADLFISLHANASFRPEVTGAVVYVASFNAADLLNERLGTERLPVFGGGLRTVEIVRWNMAQISHRAESEQLAQAVAESFTGRVPLGSNAIERAPLRLLESANMPAVLVEMGYLTNTEQEQALTTPELQNAVASALFDGVLRFREGNATRTSPAKAR